MTTTSWQHRRSRRSADPARWPHRRQGPLSRGPRPATPARIGRRRRGRSGSRSRSVPPHRRRVIVAVRSLGLLSRVRRRRRLVPASVAGRHDHGREQQLKPGSAPGSPGASAFCVAPAREHGGHVHHHRRRRPLAFGLGAGRWPCWPSAAALLRRPPVPPAVAAPWRHVAAVAAWRRSGTRHQRRAAAGRRPAARAVGPGDGPPSASSWSRPACSSGSSSARSSPPASGS